MIRNGFTCRNIMVQSVYILNILTGQYHILISESVVQVNARKNNGKRTGSQMPSILP